MSELSSFHARIIESVLRGDDPEAVLAEIASNAEQQIADAMVGVTILDRAARTFEDAIFPSLPREYALALKGAVVDELPGSCALAVFDGKTVTSPNVANDDRFQAGWRELSLTHNMTAIQSRPIIVERGVALGTLVIAFQQPREFTESDERVLESTMRLAAAALWRRRTEAQRELVVGELQHRTRNLFATIGAVVYATLKTYPAAKDFRRAFDGRIAALLRAHSLMLDASATDLHGLLRDLLAPYSIDRIELDGPSFNLGAEAAVAFSVAIHELATNASKYGALSTPEGRLGVQWSILAGERGEPTFNMRWTERGGPEVRAPKRKGFGHTAITRSLANSVDGAVTLDYAPGGLVCSIHAPMSPRLGALFS